MLGGHVEDRVTACESSSLQVSGAVSCSRNRALSVHGVPSLALVSQRCSAHLILEHAPRKGWGACYGQALARGPGGDRQHHPVTGPGGPC